MAGSDRYTDDDLQNMYRRHLPYELRMLRAAAMALSKPEPTDRDLDACQYRWMAVECFCAHLRNLDGFFYGDQGGPRDALAAHFFTRPEEWRAGGRRPERSPHMQEAVELSAATVERLSYDRRMRSEAALRWLQLADEMDSIYAAFRSALGSRWQEEGGEVELRTDAARTSPAGPRGVRGTRVPTRGGRARLFPRSARRKREQSKPG